MEIQVANRLFRNRGLHGPITSGLRRAGPHIRGAFAGDEPPCALREGAGDPREPDDDPELNLSQVEQQRRRINAYWTSFLSEARYIVCMVLLLVAILIIQRSVSFLLEYYLAKRQKFTLVQIAWWQMFVGVVVIIAVVVFAIVWHDRIEDTEDILG